MQTLTADQLTERFQVDRATLCRWRETGYLPKPIKSSTRRGVVWDATVIDAWEKTGYAEDFDQWLENRRFIENAEQLCRQAEGDQRLAQEFRELAGAGSEALQDASLTTGWRATLAMSLCTVKWWEGIGDSSPKLRRVARGMADEIRDFLRHHEAQRKQAAGRA